MDYKQFAKETVKSLASSISAALITICILLGLIYLGNPLLFDESIILTTGFSQYASQYEDDPLIANITTTITKSNLTIGILSIFDTSTLITFIKLEL